MTSGLVKIKAVMPKTRAKTVIMKNGKPVQVMTAKTKTVQKV
jgi:hypothetical protein